MSSKKWSAEFLRIIEGLPEDLDDNVKTWEKTNAVCDDLMKSFRKSLIVNSATQIVLRRVEEWVVVKIKSMLNEIAEPMKSNYSQTLKSNRALAFELRKQSERSKAFAKLNEREFLLAVAGGISKCVMDSETRSNAQTTQLDLERSHRTSVAYLLRDEPELNRQKKIIQSIDKDDKEVIMLCLRSGQFPREVSQLVGIPERTVVETIKKYSDVQNLLTSFN